MFLSAKNFQQIAIMSRYFCRFVDKKVIQQCGTQEIQAMSGIIEKFYEKSAILYPSNALCCCIILVSNKPQHEMEMASTRIKYTKTMPDTRHDQFCQIVRRQTQVLLQKINILKHSPDVPETGGLVHCPAVLGAPGVLTLRLH